MKKLKVVSFLMALVFLLNLLTVGVAAVTPEIAIDEVTGTYEAGQTVTMTVSMKNNPGFAVLRFTVKFDSGALEMIDITPATVSGAGGNATWNGASVSSEKPFKNGATGYVLYWDGSTMGGDYSNDGVLATIQFRVLDSVATGTATVSIGDVLDFYDYNENDCPMPTLTPATISVKAPTVPVTGVTLNKGSMSLTAGESETLIATVYPLDATDKTVTWASSDTSVATVDGGVVTAVAAGTATITAKAGDFTATCTVTVGCAHTNKTEHPAKGATCTEDGNIAYWSCNDCGALFSDATATTSTTQENVTIKAAHTLTKTEAKDATCTADGNIQYWECSVCHDKFSDENGTSPVTDVTIAAHHTLSSVAGKAATCTLKGEKSHWNCSACSKNFSDANGTTELTDIEIPATGHTYGDLIAETPATCVAKGMRAHYQCKVCKAYFNTENEPVGKSELETVINPTNHAVTLTKTEAKAATCTEAGNNEYYKCSACGDCFKDEAGTQKTTAEAEKIAALGHKMTKTNAKDATCTEAGNNAYWTCGTCNKVFKDEAGNTVTTAEAEKIAALGHQMTKTDAKAATCTEDGNNEYYTCSRCSKVFKDVAGNTVTTAEAEKIAALGHEYGTQIDEVPATCTKEGTKAHYKCSRCEKLFLDTTSGDAVTASDLVIDKIPHDYKGIYNETHHWTFCANCGATTDKAAHDFTVDEATGTKTCNCGYVVYGEGTALCDQHDTELVFDETHHWHVCKNCSYAEDKDAHDFGDWETDVEATTTTTDGLKHRTCKECGYVQQEVIAKPSTTPSTRPTTRPSGGSNATSSDKVKSSKTFDAGIAAYVGLSVLSLTGSALVIGKKKEF